MPQEIERKFLVSNESWRQAATGVAYRQGYLCAGRSRTVRVRIAGEHGYLTIKGATVGATRREYEYEIPFTEALAMLDELCPQPQIEKIRYAVAYGGFVWEVDEFLGPNLGLIVAEIELEHEDQPFAKPDWVGREVTGDPRYYNSALCKTPYSLWR